MSLYNALFGVNRLADILLAVLELPKEQIPRFRDCSLSENGKTINVLTRTGGGNREAYAEGNERLAAHPCYIADHDDSFDSTYALWLFSIPENYAEDLKALASEHGVDDPLKQFQGLLTKLKDGNENDPQVKRALDIGRKVFGEDFCTSVENVLDNPEP